MKKRRLFILFSLIFFLLYIAIIYYTYTENRNHLLINTKNYQVKLVQAYKEKFDEKLSALKRIVETIGKDVIKKDRQKEFKIIKNTLTNAMNSGHGFISVYLAYPDNFTISGRPDWFYTDDYVATQRPWYKEAVNSGKTTITRAYLGSPGFEDKEYISIVSPMYENKKLLGVISSDLELDFVKEDISSLLPFKKGFAFLINDYGDVIAQSTKLNLDFSNVKLKKILLEFSKEKKGNKTIEINGSSYVFTYDTLINSNWLFVSALEESELYKDLNFQLLMHLLSSFVLLVLGIGTIFFISITQKNLYEKHTLLEHFAKSPTWGILLTDKNGNIVFINQVFENIFSIKKKSMYGKTFDFAINHIKNFEQNNKKIVNFEEIKKGISKTNIYSIFKDDKIYRTQITPLFNNYQKELDGIILTLTDVTHEKELEEKEIEHEQILIQNSKMAALGEMVSAISHQWRQPLSTLLMLISSTEEMLETKDLQKANNYLNRSRQNIELMNETINAFRNFYKEDFDKREFDLVQIIDEIIIISSPQMVMNGIDLKFVYDKQNDYSYNSYPSYIKQVLINLLGNAKDELSKILKEAPLFEASIKVELSKENNKFFISVQDNGKGILKEHEKRIFEPFFTTKGEHGTGTGLYLCKLLIENKINGKFTLQNPLNPTKFVIEMEK